MTTNWGLFDVSGVGGICLNELTCETTHSLNAYISAHNSKRHKMMAFVEKNGPNWLTKNVALFCLCSTNIWPDWFDRRQTTFQKVHPNVKRSVKLNELELIKKCMRQLHFEEMRQNTYMFWEYWHNYFEILTALMHFFIRFPLFATTLTSDTTSSSGATHTSASLLWENVHAYIFNTDGYCYYLKRNRRMCVSDQMSHWVIQ